MRGRPHIALGLRPAAAPRGGGSTEAGRGTSSSQPPDRIEDGLISGAAAQRSREEPAEICDAGLSRAEVDLGQRNQEPWSTEAALERFLSNKRLPRLLEPGHVLKSLHGGDDPPVHLRGEEQA